MTAFIEKYSTPTGAGVMDGSNWPNAWDFATAAADETIGYRVNHAGNVFPTATTTIRGVYRVWRAWKADMSAPVDDFLDMPRIDFSGQVSGIGLNFALGTQTWIGFHFLNAPSYAFGSAIADNVTALFCKFTDCVGVQQNDNGCGLIFCLIDGSSGAYVVDNDGYPHLMFCEIVNCTSTRVLNGSYGNYTVIGNYVNTTGPLLLSGTSLSGHVLLNTVNGASVGLDFGTSSGAGFKVILNIISSCAVGINPPDGNGTHLFLDVFNNLFNNTIDIGPAESCYHSITGRMTDDPQYTDIANNDYSIAAPNLINKTFDEALSQAFNVGAWQESASGGGGSSFRPRIRPHGA